MKLPEGNVTFLVESLGSVCDYLHSVISLFSEVTIQKYKIYESCHFARETENIENQISTLKTRFKLCL